MDDAEESNQGKKAHLSVEDYRILVGWVEIPDNFTAIQGSDKKTIIGGGPMIAKTAAFRKMSDNLHRSSKTANLQLLSPANMQQIWNTYKQRFKKTLKLSTSQTGMGLTKKEIANGMLMPEKLEQLCPHFACMKELYGEKANITAVYTVELGIAVEDYAAVSSSDNSDIDEESGYDGGEPDLSFDYMSSNPEPLFASTITFLESTDVDDNAETLFRGLLPAPASSNSSSAMIVRHPASTTRSEPTTNTRAASTKSHASAKSTGIAHKAKPSVKDSRISLSHEFAQSSQMKFEFYKRKLEQDDRRWREERKEKEQQREFEFERQRSEHDQRESQRRQELKERESTRKQDTLLALINQGKTVEEMREYLKLAGEMQQNE